MEGYDDTADGLSHIQQKASEPWYNFAVQMSMAPKCRHILMPRSPQSSCGPKGGDRVMAMSTPTPSKTWGEWSCKGCRGKEHLLC